MTPRRAACLLADRGYHTAVQRDGMLTVQTSHYGGGDGLGELRRAVLEIPGAVVQPRSLVWRGTDRALWHYRVTVRIGDPPEHLSRTGLLVAAALARARGYGDGGSAW